MTRRAGCVAGRCECTTSQIGSDRGGRGALLEDMKIAGNVGGGFTVREGSGAISGWCQEEKRTMTASLQVESTR